MLKLKAILVSQAEAEAHDLEAQIFKAAQNFMENPLSDAFWNMDYDERVAVAEGLVPTYEDGGWPALQEAVMDRFITLVLQFDETQNS